VTPKEIIRHDFATHHQAIDGDAMRVHLPRLRNELILAETFQEDLDLAGMDVHLIGQTGHADIHPAAAGTRMEGQ
jgi:hypothetical protein